MISNQPIDLATFVALLDRCKAQVEADPEGYLLNPHLYDLQHRIYLRLCHGNIAEHALAQWIEEKHAAASATKEEDQ